MGQSRDQAESVITAKIDDDFSRAITDPTLGAAVARFGHTTATRLAALPGHPAYNRARGFTADDAGHLADICGFFADAGLPQLVEVWAGDASAPLGRQLARAGFYAAEVNATLRARPGSATATPDPAIEIRELAAGDDDTTYLDTLFDGYGLDPEAGPAARTMMAIEHRSPHLRRYLACLGGEPAAAAALYTTRRLGYLAGAATVPGMRGRGCQSALIDRRLRDAAATSQHVVVTTAFGSPSQANLQRLGFGIVHTRTLWRRLDEDRAATHAGRPGTHR